ncbi:MAG: CHAT domain-containing protein, partial [Desulfobacterales bacterium]|nr:CHAT domain-containing protein [Desulfobacterales bacterium]
MGQTGNVYISVGQAEAAHRFLTEGLKMAKASGDLELAAAIFNNLGNLFASQEKYADAGEAYTESTRLSLETGNDAQAALALANNAAAAMHMGAHHRCVTLLERAMERAARVEDSFYKVYGLINMGLAYRELRPHLPGMDGLLLRRAAEAFNKGIVAARNIGDPRSESHALGNLGGLYEGEGRFPEALELTRGAVFAAQGINAHESLYRWQWQTGRLLNAMGKIDGAISAHRRAIIALQSIRREMSGCYANPGSSFRKTAGSVCFELADLLLRRADLEESREAYEKRLMEAREVVELLKVFELREYFRDDCVDAARSEATPLDVVSRSAVVVYAILLPDRTELLVSLPPGMKKYTVRVGAEAMTREIGKFRETLEKRTTWEFLPHAQKLYTWLIRPMEPDLSSTDVRTLVFVPDGPLRTIPMAALHDGERFLIDKWAVAVTPALDLSDPRPMEREDVRVITLGLSEPVRGFPSLPYVPGELRAIEEIYGGERLLDREFLIAGMEKEMMENAFNIVHIASHGKFETNVEESFLLAFDDKITMDRLGRFVGLFRFRDDPLELLTLSACETAVGDHRAALGLAGVAIRAGARSALATLWHINDPAASELVTEFYRNLRDPSITRAGALRAAQLKLLKDPRHEHPCYWSPFLLINNWL